ncbi:MAG: ABC transporter permease [Candidatus Aminicenantes bacterium]|nr:ABC transporter permease [Candidatus Aminicenantes bacterium]
MGKIGKILKREYLIRVKKKSFIIITFLTPLLLGGLMLFPAFMSTITSEAQRKVAVVDLKGNIYPSFTQALDIPIKGGKKKFLLEKVAADVIMLPQVKERLTQRVESEELDAYIIIPSDVIAEGKAEYYARNVGNIDEIDSISKALNKVVVEERLNQEGLDPLQINRLIKRVELKTVKIVKGEEKAGGFVSEYIGTLIFVMILYMTILMYGQSIMRGVIEEKSSRVVEVLLSSVTPFQLMFGKIMGIGAVGLTQYFIWGAVILGIGGYGQSFAAQMGSELGQIEILSPATIFFFIIFFILGWLLFATMYAAVGAICNTDQEAQQAQFPIIMFLLLPILLMMYIVGNPNSGMTTILSLIPFFTPMLMFMRINLVMPPVWQIGLSIVLLVVAILLMTKLAAKIFRIGILMYGKRPSLVEIVTWMKYK